MKKSHYLLTIASLMIILLSACNIPSESSPTAGPELIKTSAALTVEALSTQIVGTDIPDIAPSPTNTLAPSETPLPTNTLPPTMTSTQPGKCDMAKFISETIPDGTNYLPSQTFTKTWTLKNAGTCTWNSSYAVVFTSGNAMGAPASKQLTTGNIAPGQSVVITMDLTSPASNGTYKGEFKLRNANGVIFGFGDDNRPFWVEIDVVTSNNNFIDNYCAATWTSGAGTLPCPGTDGSVDGYVYSDPTPLLENNAEDDDPGLWLAPQSITDGWIRGTYPAINITAGMHFKVVIGCHPSATNCNVKIKLNVSSDEFAEGTLASWTEINEGLYNSVSVDLSSLAGKSVQLILIVEANGPATDDKVLLLWPHIEP